MLYLLYPLSEIELLSFLRIFRYLTFRAMGASLTAFALSIYLAPYVIAYLKHLSFGHRNKKYGPESHRSKTGTPIMGGIIFVLPGVISALLWGDLTNGYVWIMLLSLLIFGGVGFIDDLKKTLYRKPEGIKSTTKIALQVIGSLFILYLIYMIMGYEDLTTLHSPVFKHLSIGIGLLYIPFAIAVLIGSTNAVNLTDGLDGLAIFPAALALGVLALFAYATGNVMISDYLLLNHIPGVSEISIFLAAMVGGCIGFLWYNCHPAEVFMGDFGSMSIGGSIATAVILIKNEFILPILGFVFVMEAVSVIIQVGVFKYTKGRRRYFLMAPIHHHFEKKGIHENKIVIRIWIIAVICAILALMTLKVR